LAEQDTHDPHHAGGAVAVIAFVVFRNHHRLVNQAEYAARTARDAAKSRSFHAGCQALRRCRAAGARRHPGDLANWFEPRTESPRRIFFATLAVDPESFLEVFNEA